MQPTKEAAKAAIQQLIEKFEQQKRDGRLAEMTETDVVNQFITPLLRALGWPVDDPKRYRYELHTKAGRPDIRVEYGNGKFIYVECKRFGIIKGLTRIGESSVLTPGQMMLPGMATDRTREEQQAINYAFANDGTWAILTNFERFRLFNARRDWLVMSIETESGYLGSDFDHLWQLAWHNIEAGSLDELSDQRVRADVDTDYLNFINEWRLKLAQDILARPTHNHWAYTAAGTIDLPRLRSVVQRVLDRLVVLRFAEDHLIMKPDSLRRIHELSVESEYAIPFTEQLQRIYRRFDELHNSALFAEGDADQASFSADVITGLVERLYGARFRAMTPDIMGNTYEQYLGQALAIDKQEVVARDNLETRKKQGSYYTPQVIVRYIVDNSLGRYLYGTADGKPDGRPLQDEGETRKTAEQISNLHIIDPACGSGSFLIYAYEVLADFYRREIKANEQAFEAKQAELLADRTLSPIDVQIALVPFRKLEGLLKDYPRRILETHIYGVDLDPQAAEIATVNLVMRAIADLPKDDRRLPLILNQNVKVGNALVGTAGQDAQYAPHAADLAELRRLRLELVNDTADHTAKFAQIAAISGRIEQALNEPIAPFFADLENWEDAIRPFHWAAGFPELFVDEAGQSLGEQGGFTIVVGNPPWEIVKPDLREYYAQFDELIESKLTRKKAEARIAELDRLDPRLAAGWAEQKQRIGMTATWYKKSAAYTRQGRGDTATHKLFTERAYTLLENEGRLGFVIPSGITNDLGTKQLRQMLLDEGRIDYLFNLSNERWFFKDVHHAFHFTLLGAQTGIPGEGFWAVFRFSPRESIMPSEMEQFLSIPENLIYINQSSIEKFSPERLAITEFRSEHDYQITNQIYTNYLVIGQASDVWNIEFKREFDVTTNRKIMNRSGHGIPIFEGKNIHQYDHEFEQPYLFASEKNAKKFIEKRKFESDRLQKYGLAFREIGSSTNTRTFIACILPRQSMTTYTIRVDTLSRSDVKCFVLGVFNSFVFDYLARLKTNLHLSTTYRELPMPRLEAGDKYFDAIVPRAAALTCTTEPFSDLWQEVMGVPYPQPAHGCAPTTDPVARQTLRDELDAIIAHLYGLTRDDFAHILGTFPLVFRDDEAGAQRKAAVLAMYDRVEALLADK